MRSLTAPGSAAGSRAGWSARWTLRARITVLATAVVAFSLAAGAVLAVHLIDYVLLRTIDDGARTQASVVASVVRRGALPDPLPAVGATAGVQVVDGAGRVLAASAGGDRLVALAPLSELAAVRRGGTFQLAPGRLGGDDPLLVVGAAADAGSGARTVLVAVSTAELDRSGRLLAVAAGVGVPLAVAGFAIVCWMLTGSALRPVDALRRDAARITSAGSGQRLVVPAARDAIRALAETLNAMLDRLTVADAAQRDFVADAAHELRSPVASLRVQLEVERDHPDPAVWPDTVDDLLAELTRLERLVADLLALARTDPARAVRRTGPVDLADVVRIAAERAEPRSGVSVEVREPPPGWTGEARVRGDADQLRRMVGNLLANAVAHAGSRVLLTVGSGTDSHTGTVRLEITDDGPGIAVEDRARVFDRFTRLDPDRNRMRGGSGLGLAIVAGIVTGHGGTIALSDARPFGGATGGLVVTVDLPIRDAIGPR